ncbi:alpha/beta fold hydrolase [Streptomyces sp. NPDC002742]|uniref:alpha/beta fold hydrolase n=1 Tax=Streptomyces sp. NPDC002742 TaxID=3364663 RepID=UPI0036CCA680
MDVIAQAMSAMIPGGVKRGELDRGGRVLRWVEAGADGPTVVLEAASGTPALTWTPVLSALAEHTRVIAYDRAGLGASDPAMPVTIDTGVDDLSALLSHTGNGACVLVGHSWGGMLAQLVAWAHPKLIAGLVLVDPAHEDFQPWTIRAAEAVLTWPSALRRALGLADHSFREQAAREAGKRSSDPRVQHLLVEAELACNAHEYQTRTRTAESRLLSTHIPAVRRLRACSQLPDVPVIILSATRGLPKGLRTRWTSLQAQIAATTVRGEHVVVPDAAHYIHDSQPEAVTTAVLTVVALARDGQASR